jgi:hypothetical protein
MAKYEKKKAPKNHRLKSSSLEISIIKNHLQIELAIDQVLYRLRLKRLSEISTKEDIVEKVSEFQVESSQSTPMVLQPIVLEQRHVNLKMTSKKR